MAPETGHLESLRQAIAASGNPDVARVRDLVDAVFADLDPTASRF